MKKLAVIYARVSSTDERQNYSRQIEDLKRWAEYLQLEIVSIYSEKISAFSKGIDERIEFNKMLDYIDKNNIKNIMVTEISRISRRYYDTFDFLRDCNKKKISIHIHKEQISTISRDGSENPMLKTFLSMLSDMAESESKTMSHRIKSGKLNSAKKGGGFNQKIYAYDSDENGKPVINEEQAILVKKMFSMILEGTGVRTIANFLNENYETKNWKIGSIHSILRNSFYMGKRKYLDMIIPVPEIVSPEIFNSAQKFLNNRKHFVGKVGANINPFASFIKCECGATMNQIVIKKSRADSYMCSKKCGVKSINRLFLINAVREVMEKNIENIKNVETRNLLSKKIETNLLELEVNRKRILALKIISDKNYERLLEGKIDELKYDQFESKFTSELNRIKIDNENMILSNKDIQISLSGKITHYSKDLSVFKTQLLQTLESIIIGHKTADINIKGYHFGIVLDLYRGTDLYYFNKKNKQSK